MATAGDLVVLPLMMLFMIVVFGTIFFGVSAVEISATARIYQNRVAGPGHRLLQIFHERFCERQNTKDVEEAKFSRWTAFVCADDQPIV